MNARTLLGAVAGLTLALAAALPAIAGTTTPTNITTTTTPATYTITDLGIPGIGVASGDPGQWPHPPSINSSGAVAGSYGTSTSNGAFLWQNGTFTDLGTLGGFPSSFGFTINNNGQIVGTSSSTTAAFSNENAFLWQAGTVTNLDDHPSTGGYGSEAHGINTAGVAPWAGPSAMMATPARWSSAAVASAFFRRPAARYSLL